jgi:hypothetical protein
MTPVQIAVEIAGWAGAALILLAYLLLSIGRLTGQSPVYQWMNVFGAIGFAINGWWHRALPSTALNVVWLGIGLFTLIRLTRRKAPVSASRG